MTHEICGIHTSIQKTPHTAYKGNKNSMPVLPKLPHLNFIFCKEIITQKSPKANKFFCMQGHKSILCLASQLTQHRGSLTGDKAPGYIICWAKFELFNFFFSLACLLSHIQKKPSLVHTVALKRHGNSFIDSCM